MAPVLPWPTRRIERDARLTPQFSKVLHDWLPAFPTAVAGMYRLSHSQFSTAATTLASFSSQQPPPTPPTPPEGPLRA